MLKTPPLQTATATIDTLCGRLHSATLLEDRRAAILGLRSFAKQYPASVASGSLRELIATLKRDGLRDASQAKGHEGERRSQEGGDVDTIRLILETLLMLFNPDSNSPEAGDEIAFFMADEFSMVCSIGQIMKDFEARAKLILAPRQRNIATIATRLYQSNRRLLCEIIFHTTAVCYLCCAT